MMISGIPQTAGPVASAKTGATEAVFQASVEFMVLMTAPAKAGGEGSPMQRAVLSERFQGDTWAEAGVDADQDVETLENPDAGVQALMPLGPILVEEVSPSKHGLGAPPHTGAPLVVEGSETSAAPERAQAEPMPVAPAGAKPAPATFFDPETVVPQPGPADNSLVAPSQGQRPWFGPSPAGVYQRQDPKAAPDTEDPAAPVQIEPTVSTSGRQGGRAVASAPGSSLGELLLPQVSDDTFSGSVVAAPPPDAQSALAQRGSTQGMQTPHDVTIRPQQSQIEMPPETKSPPHGAALPDKKLQPDVPRPIAQVDLRAQLPEAKHEDGPKAGDLARLLPASLTTPVADMEWEAAASAPMTALPKARLLQTPPAQIEFVRLAEWRITGIAEAGMQGRRLTATQRPEVAMPLPPIVPAESLLPKAGLPTVKAPVADLAGLPDSIRPAPKVGSHLVVVAPLPHPDLSSDPAPSVAQAENAEGQSVYGDQRLPTERPLPRPDGPLVSGLGAQPDPKVPETAGSQPATPEPMHRPAQAADSAQIDRPARPDPDQGDVPLPLPAQPVTRGAPQPRPLHDPAVMPGLLAAATAHAHVTSALPEAHALPPAPPAATPHISHQIVQAVSLAPDGPVEVTLAPEELGRVQIRLLHDGDTMRVTFLTERPDTMDLLRRHADTLSQGFRDLGYGGTTFQFGQGGTQAGDRPQVPDPAPERPTLPDLPVDMTLSRHTAETGQAMDARTKLDLRL